VPGGLSFEDLRACCTELAKRKVVGVEISEFESEWLDGRPGSADKLVDAIAPLIG
jgi:arginase family enzyme